MDVRELKQLLSTAATGSLILFGTGVLLAGNRKHEQPTRPHMSAACAPNWGFNQPCWRRFPPVPDCPGTGCDLAQDGQGSSSEGQLIYTPENSLLLPNSQITTPEYRGIQSPISVFPYSTPGASDGAATGMPALPSLNNGSSSSEIQPQFSSPEPMNGPLTPNMRDFPPASGSGLPNALPPLPSPPTPVPQIPTPDQSSLQRSYRSSGSEQPLMGLAHLSRANNGPTSSRYEISGQSGGVATPSSLTSALITNARSMPVAEPQHHQIQTVSSTGGRYGNVLRSQQIPVPNTAVPGVTRNPMALASQSRIIANQPKSSASYRSATSMPPVQATPLPLFAPTLLPLERNFPTIPSESLRSTP